MKLFDRCQQPSETLSAGDAPKSGKFYSLIPDLATGWKPKNLKIPAPILIKYRSPLVSQLLRYYRHQPARIVYLGPRYANSLAYHEKVQHEYSLRCGVSSEDMPQHMRELYFQEEEQARPFEGMNPRHNGLRFDSFFESGNLDLVVGAAEDEYNLFLRPDTNTCGHMQWFYFTVRNGKGKVRLNICNNRKAKTLFQRGMKPYIYSKKAKEMKGREWQQGGEELSYSKLTLSQQAEERVVGNEAVRIGDLEGYFCLSFQYQFQYEGDQVSFAYCPPYTYSHLRNIILDFKRIQNSQGTVLTQQKLCSSLSGLEIPLLTITEPTVNDEEKVCIVAVGRLHPGESNGSYAVEGLMQYLLSPEAKELRRQAIFKIIPMINPDGVVFGNYRTSLAGKDLNRQFRTKKEELIPEVVELKKYIQRLKYQSKQKVAYFLDFHGHSLKKNVFCYGPEYDIWSLKYEKARVLPKLLAAKTEMFRMKSCLFKVATFKKSTARAFMLAYIPYCYTIESSVGLFRDSHQQDRPFVPRKWREVGARIAQALGEVVSQMVVSTSKALQRKEKRLRKDQSQPQLAVAKEQISSSLCTEKSIAQSRSVKYLNPIRNMRKRQQRQQMQQIAEEQCESDHFSEGNSDCESEGNDLPKVQYDRLRENIINLIDIFQVEMLGKKRNIMQGAKKDRRIVKIRKAREALHRKKSSEEMLLVPSLKHRLDKICMSQKKISLLNSLNLIEGAANYRVRRYDRNTSPINHI